MKWLIVHFPTFANILVFLEPLLRPSGQWFITTEIGVSILVFLEPLLRLFSSPPSSSFDAVSILVFLEPLLRLERWIRNGKKFERFQSLFFWNHYLDVHQCYRQKSQHPVSILVFLEPLLRLMALLFGVDSVTEFQSLFFWNHYLDDVRRRLSPFYLISFNPCFSGTTT